MTDENGGGQHVRWRMPRWGWALLTLSLALNLLVAGSMIGIALSGKHHGWRDGRGPGEGRGGLGRVLRQLPEEQRVAVRNLFEQQREAVRPLRRQVREETRALRKLVAEENFDRAEFERRLSRILDMRIDIQKRVGALARDVLPLLPPEVRGRVLSRLLGRGGPKRRRRGG
ncbi:MAG: periplasmic heavy metal sensor [Pseudomonadota bacterium]